MEADPPRSLRRPTLATRRAAPPGAGPARADARELCPRLCRGGRPRRRRAAPTRRGQAGAWVALVERLARGLERGGRQWTRGAHARTACAACSTAAAATRSACCTACSMLMAAWEDDQPLATPARDRRRATRRWTRRAAGAARAAPRPRWLPLVASLREHACVPRLPRDEPRAAELADAAGARWSRRWPPKAPSPAWLAELEAPGPARAAPVRAPPAPGRPAGRAVPRADAGPDRAGRGRQLGARPVREPCRRGWPKA